MSMEQDKAAVLAVYPDAYAAFLGGGVILNQKLPPEGWIIRRGKEGDWHPIATERSETQEEAWASARSRIEATPEPKRHSDGFYSPGVQKPGEVFDPERVERYCVRQGHDWIFADEYDSLLSAYRARGERIVALETAAKLLLDTMETCHICKGSIILDENATHCENCSYDCDDHEEPRCVPIYVLHQNLRKLLAAPAKEGE